MTTNWSKEKRDDSAHGEREAEQNLPVHPASQSQIYHLALDEEEREELLKVLEQCATESRDEKRHTDSTQYRDRVAREETRLRALLEKVRRLT